MPLTAVEREISKAVVRQFIAENDSTSRRSLLKQFKGAVPQALERLVNLSVLKNVGNSNEQFLPWAVAFHYCGDSEALRIGKTSVEVVLRAVRALFEKELEQGDQKEYSPANIEAEARQQNAEIKPETIRVGLYLAEEFGVFAGMRRNSSQAGMESVRIGEHALTLGDINKVWDDHIERNRARFERDGPTPLASEAGPYASVRKLPRSGTQEQLFSSERPIKTLAEDELGRRDFARAIAKVLGQWTGRDSLVVAIYGVWGSGKTSLKNMVLDALREQKAKTIQLEFNPWEWAGQQKVFEGFFSELSSKLGSVDASENAAKAAKKIRMYGTMLSAAGSIAGRFRWFLVALFGALGSFGLAPLLHSARLLTTTSILGALALFVAACLAAFGDTANKIAEHLTAKAEATRKSVAEIKAELRNLLEALTINVLVLVDDVDRLTPEGIRMVFQLVKANADFPNLVYLLLFQRETIEKALAGMGAAHEVDGAEFLQKVVQVGFDIPKLSPKKLEESFESVINRVVEGTRADQKFDPRRWAKLFVSGIAPYFETLRDVKRFSNTLSFHFELFRNGDAFDANPIDLIALEVLRQFEASIYQMLHENKALLTGLPREPFGPPFAGGRKKALESLLESASRRTEATEILKDLFPPIVRALAESEGLGLSDQPPAAAFRTEWLKGLRTCHPDNFDRYFRFSLPAEDISEAQLNSLLAAVGDQNILDRKLVEIHEQGLLGSAILRLRANVPEIPKESVVPFVTGLLDMESELLTQRPSTGLATVPIHMQAALIIQSVLRQQPTEVRAHLLREAITRTKALYLQILCFEFSEELRKQAPDPLLSEDGAKSLQELCIDKIRQAKLEYEWLLTHPMLRHILASWSKADASEVSAWVAQVSASDARLLSLLKAFVEQRNFIESGRTFQSEYRFALEEFARHIKPESIEQAVRRLPVSDGENGFVSRLFLRALSRFKAEGQNPDPHDYEEWTTIDQL